MPFLAILVVKELAQRHSCGAKNAGRDLGLKMKDLKKSIQDSHCLISVLLEREGGDTVLHNLESQGFVSTYIETAT